MRPPFALHYTESGASGAPAILFLHGITGSRRYWERKVRPLARNYRLVLPDLIGFGLSPKPHLEYTIELFRDSVRGLVEELGLTDRPLILVGHSLGSVIALEYAACYGDHVSRMVLLSLPRFADPVAAHTIFWRGSPHYRRLLNEHSLGETLAQARRSGLEVTLRYLFRFPLAVLIDSHKFTFKSLTSTLEHCLLNYQVDRILPAVPPVPTLLIHGEKDSVAPLEHVRSLPESYRGMRLQAIRGTGHHLFLTHTRECLVLIGRFLAEARESEEILHGAKTGRQYNQR
ncbi:MAG TPA: alpha/beta hydrolase [Candidatus Polarisedimenticolia bacterium]|nr:alpha/beta hydrolase [Candidatus Polarisedimenticolia bacterium]